MKNAEMTVRDAQELKCILEKSSSDGRRMILDFLVNGNFNNYELFDAKGRQIIANRGGEWIHGESLKQRELRIIGLMDLVKDLTDEHLAELWLWAVFMLDEQQKNKEKGD